MSSPRLTSEQKDDIVALYVRGERLERIADRFKIHLSYVRILARRRGMPRRTWDSSAKGFR